MDTSEANPDNYGHLPEVTVNANGKTEWVKLVAGMEKAAAFRETHRYASLLGAAVGDLTGEVSQVKLSKAQSEWVACV